MAISTCAPARAHWQSHLHPFLSHFLAGAQDALRKLEGKGGVTGEKAGNLLRTGASQSYGVWLGAQRALAAVMLGESDGSGKRPEQPEKGGGEGGVRGKMEFTGM